MPDTDQKKSLIAQLTEILRFATGLGPKPKDDPEGSGVSSANPLLFKKANPDPPPIENQSPKEKETQMLVSQVREILGPKKKKPK